MSTSRGRAALSAAHWEPCRQLDLFPNTIIQSQYNFGTWNSTYRIRFFPFFRFFPVFFCFYPFLVLKTTLKSTKLDKFSFLPDFLWIKSGTLNGTYRNGTYRNGPTKTGPTGPGRTCFVHVSDWKPLKIASIWQLSALHSIICPKTDFPGRHGKREGGKHFFC